MVKKTGSWDILKHAKSQKITQLPMKITKIIPNRTVNLKKSRI